MKLYDVIVARRLRVGEQSKKVEPNRANFGRLLNVKVGQALTWDEAKEMKKVYQDARIVPSKLTEKPATTDVVTESRIETDKDQNQKEMDDGHASDDVDGEPGTGPGDAVFAAGEAGDELLSGEQPAVHE